MAPYRLLFVEDDSDTVVLVRHILREAAGSRFIVEPVPRLATALDRLNCDGVDLILLDLGLPDSQGLDTLRTVRAHAPSLPIIVLTGLDDEETAAEAVQAGAQDYLIKGSLTGELLARALRYSIERKRGEESLRKAVERLRELGSIVNRSPAMVFLWRVADEWPVEFVSDNVSQLGYTAEEFTSGRVSWPGITHPEDDARLRAEVATYIEMGKTEFVQQYRLFDKAGNIRWMEDRNAVIKDAEGRITHVQGIILDVTNRRRAEEALRAAHAELEQRVRERTADLEKANAILRTEIGERQRTEWELGKARRDWEDIFQAIGQPTMILDPDQNVVLVNRSMTILTGQPESALRGRKCYQIHHGTDQPPDGCPMKTAVTTHRIETAEIEVQALGGVFLVSCTPVCDDTGRLQKIIHIATDITELRRAQREVTEQKQAAQLQRMESLAATGRLAAGIAHEINNPLQGIIAQLRLLADELPEPLRNGKRVKLIHGSVGKISTIVASLLHLHRAPRQGEESCSVAAVLGNMKELVAPMVAELGVRVGIAVQPPDLRVPLSATALAQILLNLALNAIDAMPQGGLLQIEAAGERGGAVLRVSDTGTGIAPEDRCKLFSPFFTTKGPKGTGLGLSVTHSLVTSAGGAIEAVDREGGGATFVIRFGTDSAAPSAPAR